MVVASFQGVPGLIVHAAGKLKDTKTVTASDQTADALRRLEQWGASAECEAIIEQWKQEDPRTVSVFKAARLPEPVPVTALEQPVPQDRHKPSRFNRWRQSKQDAESGTFFAASKAQSWVEVELDEFRGSCGRLFESITKNTQRPLAKSELDWIAGVMQERAAWNAEYTGCPTPHAKRPSSLFMTEEMFVQQVSWLEQAGLLIEELGVRPCSAQCVCG